MSGAATRARPSSRSPRARGRKLPRRYAPVLFALIMSVTLSGVLSATITAIETGVSPGYLDRWLHAYALAWSLAFPAVTLLAPIVRRFVERITA